MYWRAVQITKAVREYDRELYAEYSHGRIDILRKTYTYVPYDVDGVTILVCKEEPYRVLCLTDTWNAWGKPVDWGIEPIMAKLRRSDLWKRDIASEVVSHNEKIKETKSRDMKNNLEGFLSDNRSKFKRAFGDINTSLLDKKKDRRYLDDKKVKN